MPREPQNRRRPLLIGVGTAFVLAALIAGCTPQPMPTPTPTPTRTVTPSGDGVLRIGTLLPTGGGSLHGAAQLAGVRAAVREINAAGGVDGTPVELVSRDSGDESGDAAERAFAALVERGVDVVIGPSSATLVERMLPLAREAGIPLISPAATAPGLGAAADGFFARTIPAIPLQGAVLGELLIENGASTVALIVGSDDVSPMIAAPLEAALTEVEGELTTASVADAASAASAVRTLVRERPDAVVLATSDAEVTAAVLGALVDARHAGAKLWLASPSLGDHSQTLPAGALEGVRGIREGVLPDEVFLATLRVEDPALGSAPSAAEAYDATVIAALAAVLAGDDGGASIAWRLRDVTRDGIPCTSFGACLDVLDTEPAIAYAGLTGGLELDASGTPTRAAYALYRFDGENRAQLEGPIHGVLATGEEM